MVRHVRGSFEEVLAVTRAAVITGLALVALAFFGDPSLFPRSTPVLGTALAIVLMLALRFVVRSWRTRRTGTKPGAERVIIFGAGLAGRRLVHSLLHDDRAKMVPVALLDDDKGKRRLRIEGVPVRGNRHHMGAVAQKVGATHLVVAMPKAEPDTLREIRDLAVAAELAVKMLPPIDEWARLSHPQSSDLRDINLEDLLGRHAVELDQASISDHLTGKVVLVTGAGGSIGSELCRQIKRFNPARLVLLDRDESALHSAQLSMTGRALLHGEDLLLADIRDENRLISEFAEIRPDVVFHAAALKHLSLLERYPSEAWQTNVLGTLNVLKAASAAGVGTFVNISTDKAASPTSVLGYSKRIAERLTAWYAQHEPGRYVSVRFGNVLGSRGSVIPAFTEQIRQGGPVTVTHPDVERYFMLIPEASQLVLQAGAIGRDGRVMVLDMGMPVKIVDVAQELIAMSGKVVDIQFTGLRPGEKLTEVLFTSGEQHLQTEHPLITAVTVPSIRVTQVTAVDAAPGQITSVMRAQAQTGVVRNTELTQ
ncbi:polysaccharide biosynthesis protein [Ornithinimicrobium pratense]|uniref:Polysaccharide biosynthesis protein n=2 Tax=Ornithinimicrobium pratense TaxID=2593973 RepID=A0A5J6V8G8_9MICO|nr:polysaccharide biosynthesis protein [Ornithinimicrobium pratense]